MSLPPRASARVSRRRAVAALRVAETRDITPGYVVIRPNRLRPASNAVRLLVVLILLVSVALILIVTIGAWSELEGMTAINFFCCVLYLVVAFYIWRWERGLLPIAAALGILMLITALVAGTGLGGTSWADRNGAAFAAAQSLFGGPGLDSSALDTFTVLLIPVELLLIVFAMVGFSQAWHVELEIPAEEARRRGIGPTHHAPRASA